MVYARGQKCEKHHIRNHHRYTPVHRRQQVTQTQLRQLGLYPNLDIGTQALLEKQTGAQNLFWNDVVVFIRAQTQAKTWLEDEILLTMNLHRTDGFPVVGKSMRILPFTQAD
jgi:hypothetical protein